MYKAALSNEAKRGRNKFSGYKPKRKQINGRNKVKKKISLVLLTVLMICSCGKKQDLANSASPTKYVDSHDITNNNLNTNMLSLTEEQMNMILPYIKYGCYAIIAVGIAAVAYTTPIAYNYIFSPAGTLIMKGLSKFCRIYCHQNHKKWVELIPHIEVCLNTTVASTTWYTPVELMFEAKRPNLFEEILPEITGGETDQEEIQDKIANAYERIKEKINKRKKRRRRGNPNWKPSLHEKVLLKIQPY